MQAQRYSAERIMHHFDPQRFVDSYPEPYRLTDADKRWLKDVRRYADQVDGVAPMGRRDQIAPQRLEATRKAISKGEKAARGGSRSELEWWLKQANVLKAWELDARLRIELGLDADIAEQELLNIESSLEQIRAYVYSQSPRVVVVEESEQVERRSVVLGYKARMLPNGKPREQCTRAKMFRRVTTKRRGYPQSLEPGGIQDRYRYDWPEWVPAPPLPTHTFDVNGHAYIPECLKEAEPPWNVCKCGLETDAPKKFRRCYVDRLTAYPVRGYQLSTGGRALRREDDWQEVIKAAETGATTHKPFTGAEWVLAHQHEVSGPRDYRRRWTKACTPSECVRPGDHPQPWDTHSRRFHGGDRLLSLDLPGGSPVTKRVRLWIEKERPQVDEWINGIRSKVFTTPTSVVTATGKRPNAKPVDRLLMRPGAELHLTPMTNDDVRALIVIEKEGCEGERGWWPRSAIDLRRLVIGCRRSSVDDRPVSSPLERVRAELDAGLSIGSPQSTRRTASAPRPWPPLAPMTDAQVAELLCLPIPEPLAMAA